MENANENRASNAGGMGSGGGKSLLEKSLGRKIEIYFYPYQLTSKDVLSDGPQSIGNSSFKLESNTMLIWVDLVPEARFVHPTAYILISASNTRVEKGGWWPVLNGQQILYGQTNPVSITSPFELNVEGFDRKDLFSTIDKLDFGYITPDKSVNIYKVNSIDLAVIKTNPPKLQINALGMVRTSGWKNPTLKPRVYIQEPPDGIWEFDFVADPPTGIALQIVSPIGCSYLYEGDFSKWNGVRIISETNSVEKKFGEALAMSDSGHIVMEVV